VIFAVAFISHLQLNSSARFISPHRSQAAQVFLIGFYNLIPRSESACLKSPFGVERYHLYRAPQACVTCLPIKNGLAD